MKKSIIIFSMLLAVCTVISAKIKSKPVAKHIKWSHNFLGVPVVAGSYLGMATSYNGKKWRLYYSPTNEDLRLLIQRQEENAYRVKRGLSITDTRPKLEIGGYLEGLAFVNSNYVGRSSSDINLNAAQFELLNELGPWATAAAAITYSSASPAVGYRTSNSNIQLSRAFVTIGNLDRFPIYFTAGQIFVPFGNLSKYVVSAPLTRNVAMTKERVLELGFYKRGVYGSVYAFKGDSKIGGRNNGGVNLGYKSTYKRWWWKFGAGVIVNIADAAGMQINGLSTASGNFGGFSSATGNQWIGHRVPGADAYAQLRYGPYRVMSEYVTTTKAFAPQDMTFDGRGAKVKAFDVELGYYVFHLFGKPTSFALGYGHTWQALALNVPEQMYTAKLGIGILPNVIAYLEYRHDVNYRSTDTATGSGALVPSPTGRRGRNIYTAKIGFYL